MRNLFRPAAALAGICGITGYNLLQWKEETRDEEINRDRCQNALQRLPSLEDAQKTRARHIPKFLNDAEVDELESEIRKIQPACGQSMRDAVGVRQHTHTAWRTTYLHTDGLFANHLPRWLERVESLAQRVDREEGWVHASLLLHEVEYSVRTCLVYTSHYDRRLVRVSYECMSRCEMAVATLFVTAHVAM